jgi:hypothetical protein
MPNKRPMSQHALGVSKQSTKEQASGLVVLRNKLAK